MRWQLVAVSFVALLLSPSLGQSYTIVTRGGERVDIGEFYWIAGSTVVWVTARGERRSVDLVRIDLDATARQNREAVAVFVDRAIRRGAALVTSAPAAPVRSESETESITITTADLAPLREERERDEARNRTPPSVLPPVGLPARAESDDSEAAARAEERWRDEARSLREELDVEQSQIDALRSELAYRDANPRKFRLSNEYNGGTGAVLVDRRRGGRYPVYGYTTGSTYNRADDEYAQMNSRLIDLEIQHRGTLSRWDAFLERARRAGVPPGWLRE